MSVEASVDPELGENTSCMSSEFFDLVAVAHLALEITRPCWVDIGSEAARGDDTGDGYTAGAITVDSFATHRSPWTVAPIPNFSSTVKNSKTSIPTIAAPVTMDWMTKRLVALMLVRIVAIAVSRLHLLQQFEGISGSNENDDLTSEEDNNVLIQISKWIQGDFSTTAICNAILAVARNSPDGHLYFCENTHQPDDPISKQTHILPYISTVVVQQMQHYVHSILQRYRQVCYHSALHAYHVAVSANKLLDLMLLKERRHRKRNRHCRRRTYGLQRDTLAQFALMFSALVHDVDHNGVSNRQLVIEADPIALLYNDQSVAEQRSLNIAFSVFMLDLYQDLRRIIFFLPLQHHPNLSTDKEDFMHKNYTYFRKMVIDLVLTTDIASPERMQIVKSRWKEAFGDSYPPSNYYCSNGRSTLSPTKQVHQDNTCDRSMKTPVNNGASHTVTLDCISPSRTEKGASSTNAVGMERKKGSKPSTPRLDQVSLLRIDSDDSSHQSLAVPSFHTTASLHTTTLNDITMTNSEYGHGGNLYDDKHYNFRRLDGSQSDSSSHSSATLISSPENNIAAYLSADHQQCDHEQNKSLGGEVQRQQLQQRKPSSARSEDVTLTSISHSLHRRRFSVPNILVKSRVHRFRLGICRALDFTGNAIEAFPNDTLQKNVTPGRKDALAPSTRTQTLSPGAHSQIEVPENDNHDASMRIQSIDNLQERSQGDLPMRSCLDDTCKEEIHADNDSKQTKPRIDLPVEIKENLETDDDTEVEDEPNDLKAVVVLEQLMKAADVAALMQNWDTMIKWSNNLFREQMTCFSAGRGYDAKNGWFDNQLTFFESYALPLSRRLAECNVFHDEVGRIFSMYVERNRNRWLTEGSCVTAKMIIDWELR